MAPDLQCTLHLPVLLGDPDDPSNRKLVADITEARKNDAVKVITGDDIVDEFRGLLNDAAAVFGIARSALPLVSRQLQDFAALAQMKPVDLLHLSMAEDSTREGPGDAFAAWPLERVPSVMSNDGAVARQIGHQWVIHVYHLWENHYREEIAATKGLNNKNELQNPHMGDLAKIRHDILKHRGVASQQNSGQCKILRWFEPGQDILISDSMVYEFMEAFGLVYPGSGTVDPGRIAYKFQGLAESPILLRPVERSENLLSGTIRSLTGRPVEVDSLRASVRGQPFVLGGQEGQPTATGIEVFKNPIDECSATIIFQVPSDFVAKVRARQATANWSIGASIPQQASRKAVPVTWDRDDILLAEAVAPEGYWYDLTSYAQQVNEWLPLTSRLGDLYEGQLISAQHGNKNKGRRWLHLQLRVMPKLADQVRQGTVTLRLPLDLPDP